MNFQRIFNNTQSLIKNQSKVISKLSNYIKEPIFIKIHGPTGEAIIKDVDLTQKTCLITGGTSGIGSEIVRCLSNRNCNILIACRNPYAACVASKTIWNSSSAITTYKTDFASLSSVKSSTEKIVNENKKIDIVILSAAVFGLPWTLTEDGLETIFQVNYLSQFMFLLNIEKVLAPDARVVIVSSESHRNVNWSIEETLAPTEEMVSLPKEEYTSIKAYNISKLCGILAMHYLAQRWKDTDISVFCTHPGSFVKTKLCTNWWVWEALYTFMYPFSKSIHQAASTPLFCATSPLLQDYTDLYYKDCRPNSESELASDRYLAFKITDLSRSIIRDRLKEMKDLKENKNKNDFTRQSKKPEDILANEKHEIDNESILS